MLLIARKVGGYTLYEKPPDRGWAWIVLFSSFCIWAIVFAIAKTIGIFYIEFRAEFEATHSQTAWIASICMSMNGLAAPLIGFLMKRFGARNVVFTSAICGCIGMILAAYSPAIWMLYIGIGLVWGVCFSSSVVCTSAQVNLYFGKRKGLANGISASGSSIGAIGLPYLAKYLIITLGWRGALLLFGGMTLNICVFASLIRPISVLSPKEEKKYRRVNILPKPAKAERIKSMNVSMEVLDYMREAVNQEDVLKEEKRPNLRKVLNDYWMLGLLGVAELAVGACVFIPMLYIVPFAKEIGCTSEQRTLLLAFISIGDTVARPLCGALLSFIKALEKYFLFFISTVALLLAGIQVLMTFFEDFDKLLILSAIYGCFYGMFISCVLVALVVLLGVENVEKYIGWKFFLSGISTLIGPPLAGFMADQYGSLRVVYWYAAANSLLASIIYCVCGIAVTKYGAVLPEHRPVKEEG